MFIVSVFMGLLELKAHSSCGHKCQTTDIARGFDPPHSISRQHRILGRLLHSAVIVLQSVADLKARLFRASAGVNRGLSCREGEKEEIEYIVEDLEVGSRKVDTSWDMTLRLHLPGIRSVCILRLSKIRFRVKSSLRLAPPRQRCEAAQGRGSAKGIVVPESSPCFSLYSI